MQAQPRWLWRPADELRGAACYWVVVGEVTHDPGTWAPSVCPFLRAPLLGGLCELTGGLVSPLLATSATPAVSSRR